MYRGFLCRPVKMGFCLGGNLYGSNPDARYTDEALSRLDMQVYLSTTLNTGHAHGLAEETLILPVRHATRKRSHNPGIDV